MNLFFILLVLLFVCAEGSVYTGYGQPYPNYQWNYQTPYQPKPLPLQRPVVPGSPQWNRLEFIKKYQAFQRSRTGEVIYGPKSQEITKFEEEALSYVNDHRHLHQVGDLTLDHELSKQAANFAFRLAQDMKVEHSPEYERPNQYENIAAGCKVSGPGLTALEAVKYWYQTICYHFWMQSEPNEKARPFTNMIWRSSNRVGIGYANFKTKDGFNCSVIISRYTPNDGDFSSNVNKGLFEPTNCQYVNDRDKPDFIQPQIENCKVSEGYHGQIVDRDSSCSFNQLFNAFGASKRKGKLSFRVVL